MVARGYGRRDARVIPGLQRTAMNRVAGGQEAGNTDFVFDHQNTHSAISMACAPFRRLHHSVGKSMPVSDGRGNLPPGLGCGKLEARSRATRISITILSSCCNRRVTFGAYAPSDMVGVPKEWDDV
jgi:hypothetical protein